MIYEHVNNLLSPGLSTKHTLDNEAIQEEISKLESDNIDIHPIPWKNLLIIPRGIKGLPPNWDSPSMERIGYATNKVKYQAIGKGSMNASGTDNSFINTKDVNVTSSALRRTRAGGYVVPPKVTNKM